MKHQNNFNALRLLLAALVIVSHSYSLHDGNGSREPLLILTGTVTFGMVAVAGFFILSGYLITASWERSSGLGDYLKRRCLRIYPGFVVASVFSVLFVGALGASSAVAYWLAINWPNLVRSCATLGQPGSPPTFVGDGYPEVNGSLWTIRYEALCYLMVAAVGLTGWGKRRDVWLGLWGLALLVLLEPRLLFWFTTRLSRLQVFAEVPLRAEICARFGACFLAGSVWYRFRERIRVVPVGVALALALLFLGVWVERFAFVALAIGGTYLLMAAGLSAVPFLQGVGTRRDLSYGLYLYGWPAQKLLLVAFPRMGTWSLTCAALPLALIAAWGSWHLVEEPFLRRKTRGKHPSPDVCAANS